MESSYADLEARALPLKPGKAVKITDVLDPLIAEAIERFARGEVVQFQVIAQAYPNPAEEGRWEPMAMVCLTIPSLIPDQRIRCESQPLPLVTGWRQEEVDGLIQQMLGTCFDQRDASEAQLSEHADHRPMHATSTGLIVPD